MVTLFSILSNSLLLVVIALESMLLVLTCLSVVFGYFLDDLGGLVLAVYLLPLAGAESAISLAYLVALCPSRGSISIS